MLIKLGKPEAMKRMISTAICLFLLLLGSLLAQASESKEDTSTGFSREELDTMMEQRLTANVDAEKSGDWSRLTEFHTSDAVYSWNMGRNISLPGIEKRSKTLLWDGS